MALIEQSPIEKLWSWLAQRLKAARTPIPPQPDPNPASRPPRDIVWRQDGPEPGLWVEILRRPDGLYNFTEWKRQRLSAPQIAPWDADIATYESGLYSSKNEALQALPDHIDWLAE